jgi:hypothetical protein
MILWELPLEVLECFTAVYVLTYLFEGSDMAAYLKLNGVPYRLTTLDHERNLVDHDDSYDFARLATRRHLITVVEDPRSSRRSRSAIISPPRVPGFMGNRSSPRCAMPQSCASGRGTCCRCGWPSRVFSFSTTGWRCATSRSWYGDRGPPACPATNISSP